jgi:hypothetical protein
MEPKLDTGMVLPEETEQSLLPPFNVKDTLSPLQALSIIMRIWSCEVGVECSVVVGVAPSPNGYTIV